MIDPRNILSSDFFYSLPPDRIAQFPLQKRNASKLLLYKKGNISHTEFRYLPNHLPENSLIIFNNTRVIHARLEFFKISGARIEVFCLEPYIPSDYALSFAQNYSCQWKCMVGNLKKWKKEKLFKTLNINNIEIEFSVIYIKAEDTYHIIEFEWSEDISFAEILQSCGEIPIPPYLDRDSEESDKTRYQTVYSRINGSVAAPTAGLHFTEKEIQQLAPKNIDSENLTLHVGAGTFRPLQSKTLGEHSMHCEHFIISLRLIKKLIKYYPNIIAVGTTSVRTLESLIFIGNKLENQLKIDHLHVNQWDVYDSKFSSDALFALKSIENYLIRNNISQLNASTSIMIAPGYKFELVSGMITNFHQPQSTLLALVTAFIGNRWKDVYTYALENEFRFLSYGDSSLLLP